MAQKEIAIKVENIHKTFQLPHANHSGVKQLIINLLRGKYEKGYENQHVLKGVSFEINKGDFIGVVGRNGSGKSTLLKLLAGIYIPDSGGISVKGSLVPFIELGVGFNPELTGRENVFLNGALLGFSHSQMEAMYNEIVEFAELSRFMDQKLKNYSSGMQVRLAFSIAIRAESDILVLDEVLAVGDAAFQQKCFDYFMQLKKEGRTVVLVTHDMSSVQRFCNRAIYLKNGEIIHDGKTSEVAKIYIEENINNSPINGDSSVAIADKLSMTISEKADNYLDIEFRYSTTGDEKKFFAMSVLKDGILVAELNSLYTPVQGKKGSMIYRLDTTHLNPGAYEVTSIICREEDRHLLALAQKNVNFVVDGSDETRGGALKLDAAWRESKS